MTPRKFASRWNRFATTIVVLAVSAVACGGGASNESPASGGSATGEGWELLASRSVDEVPVDLVVVSSDETWQSTWDSAGLSGEAPAVDFDTRVVVVRTTVYGSGCEPIFRQVSIRPDAEDAVELQYVAFEPGHECAADENWHALAVAIDRSIVPDGATIRWRDEHIAVG